MVGPAHEYHYIVMEDNYPGMKPGITQYVFAMQSGWESRQSVDIKQKSVFFFFLSFHLGEMFKVNSVNYDVVMNYVSHSRLLSKGQLLL